MSHSASPSRSTTVGPTSSSLPVTGSAMRPALLTGFGMIAIGALLLVGGVIGLGGLRIPGGVLAVVNRARRWPSRG